MSNCFFFFLTSFSKVSFSHPGHVVSNTTRASFARESPVRDTLLALGQELARAPTPRDVVDPIRIGRTSALLNPSDRVRDTAVGDVTRRLVARTAPQQLTDAAKHGNRPLTARPLEGGGECIAHTHFRHSTASTFERVFSRWATSAFFGSMSMSSGSMLDRLCTVNAKALLCLMLQVVEAPSCFGRTGWSMMSRKERR